MKLSIIYVVMILSLQALTDPPFKERQLRYERVGNAYKEKEELIKKLLKSKGIDYSGFQLFIRAFKREQLLEVYAKLGKESKFHLVAEYKFCTLSGDLGPKRKQGDMQVPEGIYHIERFNPASSYYLSLGINYPNASDKILSDKRNPGGDIFIHGNCVSIGCIPITDDLIKELYVVCVEAKSKGQQQIPVHIFPTKMNDSGMKFLEQNYTSDLNNFWKNLKPMFDYFEEKNELPVVEIDLKGKYVLK